MPKPLPPETRRKIIDFDPFAPNSPSIEEFCSRLKISRRSFYNIRNRYQQDANAALHPRSSAPITARRTYDESITSTLLSIRARLKAQGWEYGPISIRFEGISTGELTAPIPSVSTIARLLRAAGAVESNPKKRPKSSVVRFQRGQAMEMWQIDGFIYTLHDTDLTRVTIYQILDDATRFDVGTCVFPANENSVDARTALEQAIAHFGAPHELLSDNGSAFNRMRQGYVGSLESYLATVGCLSITGKPGHPQTQGKNERSHRTLFRFLQAHQPHTLEECAHYIEQFRDHYNNRRPHQGLPNNLTPAAAWEIVGCVEQQPPIDPVVLQQQADHYARRRIEKQSDVPLVRQEESVPVSKMQQTEQRRRVRRFGKKPMDPDVFTFAGNNQKVVFQGMRISVPRTMRDREFYRTVTATELGFWDAITGELELLISLPVVAIARGKSYINSYNIRGVWMQHPTPLWQRKRNEAEKRFKSIDPGDLLR